MQVVTTIDIPAYVYSYFLKAAEPYPSKTAEDMMAGYLSRYVRQKMYRQAQKERKEMNDSK